MSYWGIIVPETDDVVNIVTNPSVETGTTGYTADGSGASIAASTTRARRGAKSLAVTPGGGVNNGVHYGTVSLVNGVPYTVSVDFYGAAGVPYEIYFADTSGYTIGSIATFTGIGDWQRVTITRVSTATASRRIYILKYYSADTTVFYIDGLQCVALDHDVLYFDGAHNGTWNGTAHASASTLSAQVRLAGREYSLDALGVYVLEQQGSGMPAIKQLIRTQALLDVMLYDGYKTGSRSFTLQADVIGSSRNNLHSLRKTLIGHIKPDLKAEAQPFYLTYTGANSNKKLYIKVVYDDGLGFGAIRNTGFDETVNIRLIAHDPFWAEDGDLSASLTVSQTVASADYAVCKKAGLWQALGTLNGAVRAIVRGPDGTIYIGGDFINAGGDANADYLAKWDGSALSAVSSTVLNNIVLDLAFAPDGKLYVAGLFTNVGGGASWDYLVYLSGSAFYGVFTTPPNGLVRCVAVGQDGDIYIGGDFTQLEGDAAIAYQARLRASDSTWVAMGDGILNIQTMVIGPDGYLYVGSDSNGMGGVSGANRIAKWDDTLGWSLVGPASSLNDAVRAIAFASNGIMYIGGDFTNAGGDASADYIAQFNGAIYSSLGTQPPNGAVYTLAVASEGTVYAGGAFTSIGGLLLTDRFALWNGTCWGHIDCNLPGTAVVYVIRAFTKDLYIGHGAAGTTTTSYLNTVVNSGSRQAYPKITVNRSGGTEAVVMWLKNETSGETVYMNYYLQDGETLTIDFTPGNRKVTSDFFGDVTGRAVLRGSSYSQFRLLSGTNKVSMFAALTGSPTMTTLAVWPYRYWSLDDVAA